MRQPGQHGDHLGVRSDLIHARSVTEPETGLEYPIFTRCASIMCPYGLHMQEAVEDERLAATQLSDTLLVFLMQLQSAAI